MDKMTNGPSAGVGNPYRRGKVLVGRVTRVYKLDARYSGDVPCRLIECSQPTTASLGEMPKLRVIVWRNDGCKRNELPTAHVLVEQRPRPHGGKEVRGVSADGKGGGKDDKSRQGSEGGRRTCRLDLLVWGGTPNRNPAVLISSSPDPKCWNPGTLFFSARR